MPVLVSFKQYVLFTLQGPEV